MTDGKLIPQKLAFEVLCAIQGALGTENQRVFAKAGRSLGVSFANSIPRAENIDDLMQKVTAFLRDDLQLADSVELVKEGECHVLKVRGCHLCHGKMVKDRHDITPACAVSLLPVGAVKNIEIRHARLKEIRKPGPIGDCDLVYEFECRKENS